MVQWLKRRWPGAVGRPPGRRADHGMVLVAQQHARRVARLAGLDEAGADDAALAAAELCR